MINQRKTWKVFSYLFQLSSSTCGSALSATFNCFVRLTKLETFTKSRARQRIRSHHSSWILTIGRIHMTTSRKTLAGKYRGAGDPLTPHSCRCKGVREPFDSQSCRHHRGAPDPLTPHFCSTYSFKIVRFCRESLAETISVKSSSGEKKMGQEKEDFEPDAAAPPATTTNGETNE